MDCEDNDIDIQHDFSHFRDTKVILQEDDKKHFDPLPFSTYTVEIDVVELYSSETFRHILRHVLIYVRDIDLAQYELQRTISY
jgi:hypothetical protein